MECVVQGVIETQHVAALEVLLQGLCGGTKENIKVHEIRLKSGPNLGSVPSDLHLLCNLSRPEPVWTGTWDVSRVYLSAKPLLMDRS